MNARERKEQGETSGRERKIFTVLHAICAPLILCDVCEDGWSLVKQLIHDPVFRIHFQVLERVLKVFDENVIVT
jgi:hypothetical protein